MNSPTDPTRPSPPSVREIADLTARLRALTGRGGGVDPAERAAFLADKDALINRITNADVTPTTDTRSPRERVRERYAAQDAVTEVARARAEHPGYVLVGPSARTWLRDPDTGRPAEPVSEAEHRAVRGLLAREALDSAEPGLVTGPDGHDEIHSVVVPARYQRHEWVSHDGDCSCMSCGLRVDAALVEDDDFLAPSCAGTDDPCPADQDGGGAHHLVPDGRGAAECVHCSTGYLGHDRADDGAERDTVDDHHDNADHDADHDTDLRDDDIGDDDHDGEGGARRTGDPTPSPRPVTGVAEERDVDEDVDGDRYWPAPDAPDLLGHRDLTEPPANADPREQDDAAGWPEMPEWMVEQARRTEAEVAAGTYLPAPDDPARIAARLAELRAQLDPTAANDAAVRPAGRDDQPGRADEHDERADGRDDPAAVAWWAPVGPAEEIINRDEAARRLTDRGFAPDRARELVTAYLDDTSHRIGTPVHQWGMDDHDVEAIAQTAAPVEIPEQRTDTVTDERSTRAAEPVRYARERADWETGRGADQRSYDQMMGDAARALRARPAAPADADDDRRDQLTRWHTDDQSDGDGDGADRGADAVGRVEEGPVRALDDFAPAAGPTSTDGDR